jgi:alkyldihydroxyacetonephosphate synthase
MADSKLTPNWYEGPLPERSFRSLFRWGDPQQYKHPNSGLVALMQEMLDVSADQLTQPLSLGLDPVTAEPPIALTAGQIELLETIVGPENLQTDGYSRLRASYGQAMIDALRLREGVVENLPDVVVHPRNKRDIAEIVAFCHLEGIPVYVVSGRSSVTRGCEAVRGGVTVDMSTHMNQVLAVNELNQTVTVQPGIFGPALEQALNQAQTRFGSKHAYSCGHFPQSFEFSTVGGWVLTRGAGQNSTYYGKIEDLVIAQEYVTPRGTLKTDDYPRQATGPDIDQLLIGSEGAFGVLVEVTLKIFRYQPANTRRFSYMFKTWEDAQAAGREILQAEAGFPSVFRISDPEETEVAMRMYGIAGTPAETILAALGYRANQKCLLLGTTDGDQAYSRSLSRKIRQVCRSFGAFPLSAFGVTQRWEHSRFLDPYMRDDLADFGVLIDTLECAVTWESLAEVHAGVRAVIKARPATVCMTHISHLYPQGGNLYFIFITKYQGREDYLRLQYAVLSAIQRHGAAVSHHHGVGKALSPWLPGQVGAAHMDVLRALKQHFDPKGIMNPGGTLGLDMSPEQENQRWGLGDQPERGGNHVAEELA